MSGDDKNIKILFFGDIVGTPGRNAIKYFMENFPDENKPDFVVANVENASHGFGLTEKNYNELSSYGIDCMTSGNHIWDKKDIFNYIDSAEKLLRPMNYPECVPGKGSGVFTCTDFKIGVINLLGRVFMNLVDDPFKIVEQEIKRLKEITPIILVDFHAEATAEKICLGKFCAQMGVSGFLGTHTHIQTADEKVFDCFSNIGLFNFHCLCLALARLGRTSSSQPAGGQGSSSPSGLCKLLSSNISSRIVRSSVAHPLIKPIIFPSFSATKKQSGNASILD